MELTFIKDMFDAIAPRYDLLNRLLSLRQDVYWRKRMVSALEVPQNAMVLDVASGTGDVALEILRQKGASVSVYCVDFSPGMLSMAREKIQQARENTPAPDDPIRLVAADAFHLPFAGQLFDGLTIAFGIRNIQDKVSVLKSFRKCMKPGSTLAVLELATPTKGPMATLYLLYFKAILPLIGGLVSGNPKAYRYLPDSVLHFPKPPEFEAMMRRAGFVHVKWRKLTMGIATLYTAHAG